MGEYCETEELRIAAAKDFLGSYRVCEELLGVKKFERRRKRAIEEECRCEELFLGDESIWRLKMYEIESFLASLPNGRVKLLLYYKYIKGDSVEFVSDMLGFSRRTGYRMLRRGLLMAGSRLARLKKEETPSAKQE